jgi:hypothetical protein
MVLHNSELLNVLHGEKVSPPEINCEEKVEAARESKTLTSEDLDTNSTEDSYLEEPEFAHEEYRIAEAKETTILEVNTTEGSEIIAQTGVPETMPPPPSPTPPAPSLPPPSPTSPSPATGLHTARTNHTAIITGVSFSVLLLLLGLLAIALTMKTHRKRLRAWLQRYKERTGSRQAMVQPRTIAILPQAVSKEHFSDIQWRSMYGGVIQGQEDRQEDIFTKVIREMR